MCCPCMRSLAHIQHKVVNGCSENKKFLDELLCAGIEVGVLWRDGRQFHIPQGIRMSLGLPTKKLEEVLHRLKQYVL